MYAPTITDAKYAVRTFWASRHDLGDSDTVRLTIEEISAFVAEAKADGRRLTDDEWIEMALMVDDACDDDGMPRLYDQSRGYTGDVATSVAGC